MKLFITPTSKGVSRALKCAVIANLWCTVLLAQVTGTLIVTAKATFGEQEVSAFRLIKVQETPLHHFLFQPRKTDRF